MLVDVLRGRATEVDFLNGQIVEIAAQVGVSAPSHERALGVMAELLVGDLTPAPENAARFIS